MCGIAGWVSAQGRVRADVLQDMRDRLAHRGPDGAGLWVSRDTRVGLAHRRLSIIDLSSEAAQPMHAGHMCNRSSIIFNGEIYNHADLRRELESRGVTFRTDHSDTEVIIRGYMEWGLDKLLHKLVGMFAFAIYDMEAGRVTLVRDRIGIKPLYVADTSDGVLFASEAKALFAHPRANAALDHESFPHFLSFRAVPAPRTLFQGIECLGAGELMEIDVATGKTWRRTWWDPLSNASTPPSSLKAARERLGELLEDAVHMRNEADVPVGLFLSGGVDSGYILARMARERAGVPTFTITYPGHADYDESSPAAARAHAASADHHEVRVGADDFADVLSRVAYHQDEPIAAPVCASVWFLAEAARKANVPVIQAGEGSDELFVGYENWIKLRDAERWNRRVPDVPGRLLRRGAERLGACLLPWASPHREILRRAANGQPLFWSGGMDFGEAAKARLTGPAVRTEGVSTFDDVVSPMWQRWSKHGGADDLTGWMTYVDLQLRLPQLMLPRLDKMAMAFSIEGRVPFLDHRVVEFACGLPKEWRGSVGTETKALFKSVAEAELPHDFVHRKKRGFRAPVSEWRDGALGKRFLPALRSFARRTGLLDVGALETLLAQSGDRLYFGLTNFMLWHETFIEGNAPSTSKPSTRETVAA